MGPGLVISNKKFDHLKPNRYPELIPTAILLDFEYGEKNWEKSAFKCSELGFPHLSDTVPFGRSDAVFRLHGCDGQN